MPSILCKITNSNRIIHKKIYKLPPPNVTMKNRTKKEKIRRAYPSSKKIWIALLVLIAGEVIFAFAASLPTALPISSLLFHPTVISTSVFLAVASYFITGLIKNKN